MLGKHAIQGEVVFAQEVTAREGWPNMKGSDGVPMRTTRLEKGKFNGPHGITTDSQGNIYVAEWLVGGCMIKIARVQG